jgi:hypothetical protein
MAATKTRTQKPRRQDKLEFGRPSELFENFPPPFSVKYSGIPQQPKDDFAFDESKTSGYTDETPLSQPAVSRRPRMRDDTELTDNQLIDLYRKVPKGNRGAVRDFMIAAAGEVTEGREQATPRPQDAPVPAALKTRPTTATVAHGAAPRAVTAEELFGNVPSNLQVKAHKKYEFSPELLKDPEALKAAQRIANARNKKIRGGAKLSEEEDGRGRVAESFIKQARRRQRRTEQGPQPSG